MWFSHGQMWMRQQLNVTNSLEVSVARLLWISFQLKLDVCCVRNPRCTERKRPLKPGNEPMADLQFVGKLPPSGWTKNARPFHLDFDARLHLHYTNNTVTKWQSGRTIWPHLSSNAIRSHDFKSFAEWKFLCCVQANEVSNGSLTHQTGLTRLHEIRGSLTL